jgi:hypothetical protein
LTPELKENIIEQRIQDRGLSVSLFYDQLIFKGVILPSDISYST